MRHQWKTALLVMMLLLSAAFALAFSITASALSAPASGNDTITLTVGPCDHPPLVMTQHAAIQSVSAQAGGYWSIVLTSTTVGPDDVQIICDSEQDHIGLMFTDIGGTGGGVGG